MVCGLRRSFLFENRKLIIENLRIMLNKEQKKEIVKELSLSLKKAKSAVFFDFAGLPIIKLLLLRKDLKKQGLKLKITKKNLFKFAIENFGVKDVFSAYKGSIAMIIDEKNDTEGAKILKQFKEKEASNLAILGGILESKFIDKSEVLTIADLPSREILLARLLSVMQGPSRNFVSVISAPMRDFIQILKNKH